MNFLKTLLFGCSLLGFANVKATEQFVRIGEPIIFAQDETYSISLQTINCNSNIASSYNKQQPNTKRKACCKPNTTRKTCCKPNTIRPICFKPIIFDYYGINKSYREAQPVWTAIPPQCSNPGPDTSIHVHSENTEQDTSIHVRSENTGPDTSILICSENTGPILVSSKNTEPWKDNKKLFSD